jgi:hypothetical protein
MFSSFKFLKEDFKIINKAQELELKENHIEFSYHNDDISYQQQYFHDLKDPIGCYMENFTSSKPQSCNNDALVQQFHKELQTFYGSTFIKLFKGKFNHVFQDPFASLLGISEQEVLEIYLRIISEHKSSK